MKVVVSSPESKTKERVYPYIGEFPDGELVLFYEVDTGITLKDPENVHPAGFWGCRWDEKSAKVLVGIVTLSND